MDLEQGAVVTETTETAPESLEQVEAGEVSTEVTETEPKAELSAEEKTAAEDQGFRIETDEKGRQYIVDDDGTKIPPKRFTEVYREAKAGERTKEKFDLFKRLGPEAYYQAFPEEKPAEAAAQQPAEEIRQRSTPDVDTGGLVVQQPGGSYDGMTLREVFDVDPVFATRLQTEYLWQQREDQARQASEMTRLQSESKAEIETFAGNIAKELFDKEPASLSKDEELKIAKTIQDVLDFMKTTHRGGGFIHDAYQLMTMDKKLSEARNKTAANVVDSLRKAPVGHIGGGPSQTAANDYEGMTEGQLSETVGNMTDAEKVTFYAKATPALRRKFPSWPWD
jgi:hypothetical protein